MTANIASKNLFDLLGNDPDLDPDREPEPPTQAIDKPVQRSGKRNEGPARDNVRAPAGGRGGRQEGDAPATNPREEGFRPDRMREPRGDRGDRRGGRGGRGGRGRGEGGRGEHRGNRSNRDDRGDHSGQKEHEKQAAHGWGAATGQGEYDDEKAGDVIAQAEAKNDAGFTPDVGSGDPAFTNGPTAPTAAEDVAPAEPEDNTKSYEEYLADLAEKRKALSNNTTEIRKANEGSKQKFPEGTAFQRNPENEMFFAGSGGKTKKQKEVKEKERVELDGQYYAPVAQEGGRGGRGGRGGAFRGGDRGDRGGRGGDRGDRGDRGERRGGRGRGDSRGGARGDRGGDRSDRGGAPRGGARGGFNAQDESAFPALGGN